MSMEHKKMGLQGLESFCTTYLNGHGLGSKAAENVRIPPFVQ